MGLDWEPAPVRTRPTIVRGLSMAAVALGAMTVVGCSADSETPSAGVRSLMSSPSVSGAVIPASYRYVLESSCGERGFLGRYQVVVRDGVVSSVKNLNDDYPYQPDFAEVPTLAGLAEKAQSVSHEAVVALTLDAAGLPKSLEIDHLPNAIDDEECYEVSALKVLE